MPKLNPYLIKENYKKVEEVREIENKELITPEGQEKVVDKLVKNEIPSYEEFIKTYQEDEEAVDNYYYEIDSYGDIRIIRPYGPGWGEWVLKTTIVVGGGFVLGPVPAMVVGGLTAGAAKVAEEVVDNSDDKKVFRFIGDCGGGIATGGAIGAVAQGAGALLGAGGEMAGLSSSAASAATSRAAKEFFIVDGIKIFSGNVQKARMIAVAIRGAEVAGNFETWISALKDAGYAYSEAKEHIEHVRSGYSYKSWCKVCND